MKPSQLLVRKKWCQNDWAQKEDGSSCHSNNPEAKAFCLSGVVRATAPNEKILKRWMRKLASTIKNRKDYQELMSYWWSSEENPVIKFNDDICKNKRQALRVLRSVGL